MSAEHIPSIENPNKADALYSVAFRRLEQEQFTDAAVFLRLMLHVAPDDERGWLALAVCHERLGQPAVARELFALGSVAAAPSPRCLIGLARVLAPENQEAAQLHYEKAVALAEDSEDLSVLRVAMRELEVLQ